MAQPVAGGFKRWRFAVLGVALIVQAPFLHRYLRASSASDGAARELREPARAAYVGTWTGDGQPPTPTADGAWTTTVDGNVMTRP